MEIPLTLVIFTQPLTVITAKLYWIILTEINLTHHFACRLGEPGDRAEGQDPQVECVSCPRYNTLALPAERWEVVVVAITCKLMPL